MSDAALDIRNDSESLFATVIAGALSPGCEQIAFSPSDVGCRTLTFSL